MNLLELYCHVDDFVKAFLPEWNKHLVESNKKRRHRASRLSVSEIITLLIHFHQSHYRDFKSYYLCHVNQNLRAEFPNLLSYNRLIALIPSVFAPLCAYLQSQKAESTGIGFIDSTPIIVCHPKRIYSHKVFKGVAEIGKCIFWLKSAIDSGSNRPPILVEFGH